MSSSPSPVPDPVPNKVFNRIETLVIEHEIRELPEIIKRLRESIEGVRAEFLKQAASYAEIDEEAAEEYGFDLAEWGMDEDATVTAVEREGCAALAVIIYSHVERMQSRIWSACMSVPMPGSNNWPGREAAFKNAKVEISALPSVNAALTALDLSNAFKHFDGVPVPQRPAPRWLPMAGDKIDYAAIDMERLAKRCSTFLLALLEETQKRKTRVSPPPRVFGRRPAAG